MSLYVTSLNSGSNGNCYYVGTENEAVLIDAGISCREVEKRMKRLNLSMKKVKAVFVSHEHSDHIKGVEVLSKKYQVPVYITAATLLNAGLTLEKHLIMTFSQHKFITIGSITITPFPKFHDATDPNSFIVDCNKIKVGIFTDIGSTCENVIKHFQYCHAAFLEANYDEKMLNDGNYPYHLKKRISGGMGHLSNTEALDLFRKHKPPFMSHLFLSHLSKNNNDPQLVKDLFNTNADGVEIIIASRYEETKVYHIQNLKNIQSKPKPLRITPKQLAFSFA
ncbi:MBL fold metallo-hydrolase [Ginsengibacter hankyongi]|uniref:MBL fold metallo-hydrolase n=1 Tax=Ginsengibacter hankyongi TaxID=2607284 RepID=A0A5J5IP36_9BACT|nr:MBL fold metallo-hydrolase [Ginsengibacter hankyongi]KAA9042288.1 MBL fold metallo-hydrolase [Ginsengibacter hankyongi]